MKKIIIILLLFICLTAKARIRFVETTNQRYKSTDWHKVIVYLKQDEIPASAIRIGMMFCEAESPKEMYKLYIKAKKLASDYGATGIYMLLDKDNDVLDSRTIDTQEKRYNVEKGKDFRNKITMVAVRLLQSTASDSTTSISIDDIVMFKDEDGKIKKGRVLAINSSTHTAIISLSKFGGKVEKAISTLSKSE
ncbi:MAG: hypothetical protein JST82_13985 [Bacteroidetes bacterium]|nr:hypothetical protein [Bacteroidota bacterium]